MSLLPVLLRMWSFDQVACTSGLGHYVKFPIMRSSMLLGRSMACMSAINLLMQFT